MRTHQTVDLDLLLALLQHPRVQSHPRGREVAYVLRFLRTEQAQRCTTAAELIGVWTRG